MKTHLPEKFWSVVVIVAAVGVVYLFALFAFVRNVPGLNIPSAYDDVMFYVMQAMVLASLAGSLSAYRKHRKVFPPLLATASAAAIIYGINSQLDIYYMFPGMVGMLVVSLWSSFELRKAADAEDKI